MTDTLEIKPESLEVCVGYDDEGWWFELELPTTGRKASMTGSRVEDLRRFFLKLVDTGEKLGFYKLPQLEVVQE